MYRCWVWVFLWGASALAQPICTNQSFEDVPDSVYVRLPDAEVGQSFSARVKGAFSNFGNFQDPQGQLSHFNGNVSGVPTVAGAYHFAVDADLSDPYARRVQDRDRRVTVKAKFIVHPVGGPPNKVRNFIHPGAYRVVEEHHVCRRSTDLVPIEITVFRPDVGFAKTPTIVAAHGQGPAEKYHPEAYAALMRHLASWGFYVLMPLHDNESGGYPINEQRAQQSNEAYLYLKQTDPRIDSDRTVLMGHSRGGLAMGWLVHTVAHIARVFLDPLSIMRDIDDQFMMATGFFNPFIDEYTHVGNFVWLPHVFSLGMAEHWNGVAGDRAILTTRARTDARHVGGQSGDYYWESLHESIQDQNMICNWLILAGHQCFLDRMEAAHAQTMKALNHYLVSFLHYYVNDRGSLFGNLFGRYANRASREIAETTTFAAQREDAHDEILVDDFSRYGSTTAHVFQGATTSAVELSSLNLPVVFQPYPFAAGQSVEIGIGQVRRWSDVQGPFPQMAEHLKAHSRYWWLNFYQQSFEGIEGSWELGGRDISQMTDLAFEYNGRKLQYLPVPDITVELQDTLGNSRSLSLVEAVALPYSRLSSAVQGLHTGNPITLKLALEGFAGVNLSSLRRLKIRIQGRNNPNIQIWDPMNLPAEDGVERQGISRIRFVKIPN